jgi:glycosyltransferase involved in cell wall biosynthesis
MNPRDDITSLHYVGYDNDRGGIVAVVKALAAAGRFECVLGVNETFRAGQATTTLPTFHFAPLEGERLCVRTFLRARIVAGQVRRWLAEDPGRVFHGHSRAGLAVALWLARSGEQRVVASVHCYGRQRWFYRWASRRLGHRLFWLSPAMERYYGVASSGPDAWAQCIPGCVADAPATLRAERGDAAVVRLTGIGALTPWKRWDLVLEALASLPAVERERLRFIHIGASDGSVEAEQYASALRRNAKELGLEGSVEWRGQQDSSRGLLAEADALVVASQNEPFSVAMLEALFAGVPVVAADSGGAVDVVAPGVNGWLFRSGDAADLARVLRELAQPGALASVRIDREALTRFTAAEVGRRWTAVYRRLIAPGQDT